MEFREENGRFKKGIRNPFIGFLELGRKWKKDHALTDEQKKERGWYYIGKLKYFWRNCLCCEEEYQGQGAEFCSYICSRLMVEARKAGRECKAVESLNVYKRIRSCSKYQKWRKEIYIRDNYRCVLCGEINGQLDVDHYPKSFNMILINKKINSLEDALIVKELWNINNGRTLCRECHFKTDTYGDNKQYA